MGAPHNVIKYQGLIFADRAFGPIMNDLGR
jgi:hypothetical protein